MGTVTTLCTGRSTPVPTREQALANFYSAERRAGACPIQANERMHEFAKRLDDLDFQRDLQIIRDCMERKS
jgi:hypothetical protein